MIRAFRPSRQNLAQRTSDGACTGRFRPRLFGLDSRPDLPRMQSGPEQSTRYALTGDPLDRIHQALAVAQQQVRAGQEVLDGRHLADALVEAEETLGDVAIGLRRAVDADKNDAEASGETERHRQAWYPVYRAA
jgi:hypothetical protein